MSKQTRRRGESAANRFEFVLWYVDIIGIKLIVVYKFIIHLYFVIFFDTGVIVIWGWYI